MNPRFSIITITYNAEQYIERTILSILNQDYTNVEYLIIDGASTDNTLGIVGKYRNRISTVVSEKDKGIYDAMNKGLALATGDYVWFINAGDCLHANTLLSTIVEGINAYPNLPDVVYGHTAITDAQGKFLYQRRLSPPKKLTWKSFKMGMLVCHQAFVVKRSIAPSYNLNYRFSADFDWCIRCLQASTVIYNTHLTLADYMNEGTTTQNMKLSLNERYRIMCHYYGRVTVFVLHIWFAVRFAFAKYITRKF